MLGGQHRLDHAQAARTDVDNLAGGQDDEPTASPVAPAPTKMAGPATRGGAARTEMRTRAMPASALMASTATVVPPW